MAGKKRATASKTAAPMTGAERQARHKARRRKALGRRVEFVLAQDVAFAVDALTQHHGCTQAELFGRLLMREWKRCGMPQPTYQ